MKGIPDCPYCHGSGWYGDSTTDGDEPCNSLDVMGDPAKPKLPDDSEPPFAECDTYCTECGYPVRHVTTAPPVAILLAASAVDAEVLRAGTVRSEGSPQFWDALDRARILDPATHVVLPRAEVEALLAKWRIWDPSHGSPAECAWELCALLARETGKGEG